MIGSIVVVSIIIIIGLGALFGAPYVPSHRRDVRRLFAEYISLDTHDVVVDMGSGDGVVLREISKQGAQAVGYEIHPLFVGISRLLSRGDKNVRIVWRNAWRVSFPNDVTLVYIFSVGRDSKRLVRKIQAEANRLKRPLKLVCYGNPLPHRQAQSFEAYFLYTFEPLQ